MTLAPALSRTAFTLALPVLLALGCSGGDSVEPYAVVPSSCGNGRLDALEACDGAQFGSETCATVTLNVSPVGELRCSASCVIEVGGCRSGGEGPGTGGVPGA
ncbi:MAG: hypothetical protein FJ104_08135, partial [Deltaproteobacteria bacterium]|nr:hypothetical protein [Deltaproteobacteria bacterium]